jgi:hypothetical protein
MWLLCMFVYANVYVLTSSGHYGLKIRFSGNFMFIFGNLKSFVSQTSRHCLFLLQVII